MEIKRIPRAGILYGMLHPAELVRSMECHGIHILLKMTPLIDADALAR